MRVLLLIHGLKRTKPGRISLRNSNVNVTSAQAQYSSNYSHCQWRTNPPLIGRKELTKPRSCMEITCRDFKSPRMKTNVLDLPNDEVKTTDPRSHVVVIGSGWGAFRILQKIDQNAYRVTVVSPRDYFVFTPFLPSACVGTLEQRSVIEPIRQLMRGGLSYVRACVTSMDLKGKQIEINSRALSVSHSAISTYPIYMDHNLEEGIAQPHVSTFVKKMSYDKLIIACGAVFNTFNTPGVYEYAYFLKDITDAQLIRTRIMAVFEIASLPMTPPEVRKNILHFIVVGAGPTGVEFMGELYDLIFKDLVRTFPATVINSVRMSIFDSGPKILSSFHPKVGEFTARRLKNKMGVSIRTGVRVKELRRGRMTLEDGEVIPFGLCLWATGVVQTPLIKALSSAPPQGKDLEKAVATDPLTGRILTNGQLNIFKSGLGEEMVPDNDVYAIGDCAMVLNSELPTTAQVARQKGAYLADLLNKVSKKHPLEGIPPFKYEHKGKMAYVGGNCAVVELVPPIPFLFPKSVWFIRGVPGWMTLHFVYILMIESWRNRVLVPIHWSLCMFTGRDISLIQTNKPRT